LCDVKKERGADKRGGKKPDKKKWGDAKEGELPSKGRRKRGGFTLIGGQKATREGNMDEKAGDQP